MKKLLFIISTAMLLSSCAGLTHITTPQSVALNQANFKFIKSVSAETSAIYILGIGGLSQKATEDVIELLRAKADLQANQALADIRIKTTIKHFLAGLVINRTLTASATVVEFYDTKVPIINKQEASYSTDTPTTNKQKPDSLADTQKGYTRDSAFQQLIEMKEELTDGHKENASRVITEVKNIERWYLGIDPVYSEIDEILKEIREILKNMEK